MSARHFIYGSMVEDTELLEMVGELNPRIFAKKTMTSSKEIHPFIVYKLGNETLEVANEEWEASRQFFQIWVHDYHDSDTGDYETIDKIIERLRKIFYLKNSKEEGVWITNWVETSQDLNDDTLNTLFKYVRFQLIRRAQ
ncbi:tail terminator [Microbacterium phage Huwbert]|nr:tail terminator [Microbacterium phage Huwbert]